MFKIVVALCFYGSLATGAHQHIVAFPMNGPGGKADAGYLIWQLLASQASVDYDIVTPAMQITIVARSTRTLYDYELWMVTTHEAADTYDPEFFWAVKPTMRTWLYLGTFSIMYIFMLCGVGYGGMWIETRMFMNDYEDEDFYGGIAVHIRTWCDCATWWTIDTMTLTKYTMWEQWRNLHLPWHNMGSSYGDWSYRRQGMPTIPIYKPSESYKKIKMIFSGGNSYDAKPGNPHMVPLNYINKILKLWTLKHYPSFL